MFLVVDLAHDSWLRESYDFWTLHSVGNLRVVHQTQVGKRNRAATRPAKLSRSARYHVPKRLSLVLARPHEAIGLRHHRPIGRILVGHRRLVCTPHSPLQSHYPPRGSLARISPNGNPRIVKPYFCAPMKAAWLLTGVQRSEWQKYNA